jgi:hypothetical protein
MDKRFFISSIYHDSLRNIEVGTEVMCPVGMNRATVAGRIQVENAVQWGNMAEFLATAPQHIAVDGTDSDFHEVTMVGSIWYALRVGNQWMGSDLLVHASAVRLLVDPVLGLGDKVSWNSEDLGLSVDDLGMVSAIMDLLRAPDYHRVRLALAKYLGPAFSAESIRQMMFKDRYWYLVEHQQGKHFYAESTLSREPMFY